MADRSCVVLMHEGTVLMVRQMYRGRMLWTFPGGGIEVGESPEHAAIREAYEEVGLTVRIVKLLSQRSRVASTGVYYCYLAEIIGGQALLGHDPELSDRQQELQELR